MEHLLTSPFLHFFPILQRLERMEFSLRNRAL
nr:MAG TPA: hypothetical protein [Caudoviricetes sp.]